MLLLSEKPRIVFLSLVPRVAYLVFRCELCEEFSHVVHSIALLKSLKHTVDLVCVIGCSWGQRQLCHLSRSEDRQGFGLWKEINIQSNGSNCETIVKTFQFARGKCCFSSLHSRWRIWDWGLANLSELQTQRSRQCLPVATLYSHWQMRHSQDLQTRQKQRHWWNATTIEAKTLAKWAWVSAFTWGVISWEEWFDKVCEDSVLYLFLHELPLVAEYLDAKIREKPFTHLNKRYTTGASAIWFTLVKYITYLLTQSGMIGSWSSWRSGRIGSWTMARPKGDAMSGTGFWQSRHSVAVPGWSWQFWPLQEHREHLTRLGSCCCRPEFGKIALVRSQNLHCETQISWKLWGWIYHGSK